MKKGRKETKQKREKGNKKKQDRRGNGF